MTHRTHALAVFLVMLLVIAACGVSLAHADDVATDLCGAAKAWRQAKVDSSASAKPYLAVPAIPWAFVDVSPPAPLCAAVEDTAPASSRVVLVQPLAPRAPPLA